MKKITKEAVARAHRGAPVFLGYMNAMTSFMKDGSIDYSTFFDYATRCQGSVPRLRRGGVGVATVSFGLNYPDLFPGIAGIGRLMQDIGAFIRAAEAHARIAGIATDMKEAQRLQRAGKIAFILHLTGVRLDQKMELLHGFYALGVRGGHAPFDAGAESRVDGWKGNEGLSRFGRDVVREMQRLGMVVDIAHGSDRVMRDVLRMTKAPVIVSHGMCRAISDTKRNLTDDQIRAVADTGGVIGIHFAAQLICQDYNQRQLASGWQDDLQRWVAEMKEKYPDPFEFMAMRHDSERWRKTKAHKKRQKVDRPPIGKIIDHVDHMVGLVGIDHVGVGSDYDLGNISNELNQADKLPNLTRALLERGYSQADTRKILGGNFARVYRQVLG